MPSFSYCVVYGQTLQFITSRSLVMCDHCVLDKWVLDKCRFVLEKSLKNKSSRLYEQWERIQDKTASYGVKWHFNPPLAPHFSGVHEVMIKAAKKAINAILGCADTTDEELLSAVVGAEGLINSQPLTYQSVNPKDLVPLRPNHFLHGQVGRKFAPDSVDSKAFNPKRWRRVQELVRHFWHQWMQGWLPGLSRRKKWYQEKGNIQVDVLIVMSANTPRGKWPLGRIVKTHLGVDEWVRVADVQIRKCVMKRPAAKLCPLESPWMDYYGLESIWQWQCLLDF